MYNNMPYQYMPDPNLLKFDYNNRIMIIEQHLNKLEREVKRLEHRIKILENNKQPSISLTKDDNNDMYMM